ncbi:hypothetical protein NPIL_434001 [Nephila pilipes]|uniref:Uncharacterized protein n=1 Tax=Nephila pilipes TaxID=299642 RepID=A0A8X6PD49_NEPPI|nr:hypothetical protein NPIL_434001 [Nephila pilipes]
MPKMRPPHSPLLQPIDPSFCLRKIRFAKVRNSVCVRKRTHAQLALREQPVTQTKDDNSFGRLWPVRMISTGPRTILLPV